MKILITLLITAIYSQLVLSQNSFSAKLNIPTEILEGEYSEIVLDIYKPEASRNYTVFTQKLPAGFYVKMKDAQGAVYSFENNVLTITWMRIPEEAKISVKYDIASMIGVTGNFSLSGQLSYMVGSQQGVFDLKNYPLNVLKVKPIVQHNETPEVKQISYPTLLNNILEGVECKRAIQFNKKKSVWEVDIVLRKKEEGAYSITEKIPKNFEFAELDSQGAKIIKQSDMVQFLWFKLPEDKDIKITYQLTAIGLSSEEPVIRGKLSFLKNGQILNLAIINKE